MKLFDVSQAAQMELVDTGQVEDDTPAFDKATDNKFQKKDFGSFNFN